MIRDHFAHFRDYLDKVELFKECGCYPYYRRIDQSYGNYVVCDGQEKIMLGSNNYLGLAQDPRVIEAACDAIHKFGAGCTGSRLLNGTIALHNQLEEALCIFLEREAVLLFSTGFFANQGALSTIMSSNDVILCDRENHASIIEGCRLSPARLIPYSHNSVSSLKNRLKHIPDNVDRLVIMDSLFSMSGDIANIPSMLRIAKEYGAIFYVDEAHALGVLGEKGRGGVHHFGVNKDVDIIMGTFSKSLGSMGGFIAGSSDIITYLKHKARCLVFTASLAPAVVGGVLKALEIMQSEPERIALLWRNTRTMYQGLLGIGFQLGKSQTPIIPIHVGDDQMACLFAQRLFEEGIFATPAIYPAVPNGESIVRTSCMATHTNNDLVKVLEIFEKLGKEFRFFH